MVFYRGPRAPFGSSGSRSGDGVFVASGTAVPPASRYRALAGEMVARGHRVLPETWAVAKEFGLEALEGRWTDRAPTPAEKARIETAVRALAGATASPAAPATGAHPLLEATRWLEDRNEAWAQRLAGVSLVGELDVGYAETRDLLDHLGLWWRMAGGRSSGPRLRDKYLACLMVALVAVASEEYAAGRYWPQVAARWGVDGMSAAERDLLGNLFVEGVSVLGMPTFGHLPLKHVGPITSHAAIPTFCLKDVFDLFARRLAADPDLSAAGLLAWLAEDETRQRSLDTPARVFLLEGGEFARDFTDRCLDLLTRDPAAGDEAFDGIGLPERVIAWYRTLVTDGLVEPPPPGARAQARVTAKVRLVLEPWDRGLCLSLPVQAGDEFDVDTWRLSLPGLVWQERVRRSPVGGEVLVPVPRPAPSIHVSVDSNWVAAQTVPLIEQADPLLVFDGSGRLMVAGTPVPKGPAWLIYPSPTTDTGPDDGSVASAAGLVVEGAGWNRSHREPPYGWDDWAFHEVDLTDVRSLRYGSGAKYLIEQRPVPQVVCGEPVPFVDVGGRPVLGERPWLRLPEGAAEWTVTITRLGESTPERVAVFDTGGALVDPWPDGPVCGTFTISVRGPLGRRMSRQIVCVVEGLAAAGSPGFRSMGPAGLAPGLVQVRVPRWLGQNTTVVLDEGQVERTVQIGRTAQTVALRVRMPHGWVQWIPADGAGSRQTRPIEAVSDAVHDDPGYLLVCAEGVSAYSDLHYTVDGVRIQTVRAQRTPLPGVVRFGLHGLTDTLRSRPCGDLVLDGGLPMMRLLPSVLAADVVREDGMLWVEGSAVRDSLVADVYFCSFPWRGPVTCKANAEGRVHMPAPLADPRGRLLVGLRVDDGWGSSATPPPWPEADADSVFEILPDPDGLAPRLTAEEAAFVAGLNSEAPMPRTVEATRRLFALLVGDRWEHLPPSEFADESRRDDVLGALRQGSRFTLHALLSLDVPAELATRALVESRLAAEPLVALHYKDVERLWPQYPVAAMLASSESLRIRDKRYVKQAVTHCGPTWTQLAGKEPQCPSAAGAWLQDHKGWHIRGVADLHAPVVVRPGLTRLLDDDARIAASCDLYAVAAEQRLGPLLARTTLGTEIERVLIRARLGSKIGPVLRARAHAAHGWRALPALCLGLAVIARLAARGNRYARDAFESYAEDFAALTAVAPSAVATDLLLAEALLIGHGH